MTDSVQDGCSSDVRRMRFSLPIRVGLDSMEGLLIATFDGDPEFESIEPQVFDDPINGKGMNTRNS